jgi:glycosyltransferase involved in cell wall biosynthesis
MRFDSTWIKARFQKGARCPTGSQRRGNGPVGEVIRADAVALLADAGIGRVEVEGSRKVPDGGLGVVGSFIGDGDASGGPVGLGIGDRVTLTGAVPYEEAGAYLALGDLAVAPKLSLTEGNGKLVNYMAMGLPVVAFDSPVSREILGDLGIYAPGGYWTALSIEIELALADLPAARDRGRALRARAVAKHSWDDTIELMLGVYRRVLGTKGTAGS